MLRSINDLRGLSIHATDGDLGQTDDFYFDDQDWAIRYVVADVGSWLERHKVLISPASIQIIAPDLKRLMTTLTKTQVKDSPDWDTDKPVSRQYEALFADYYRYPYYWGGPALWGFAPYPAQDAVTTGLQTPPPEQMADLKAEIAQSHLRSANAVHRYAIEATDGEIGTVDDFIFDEESWQIHYLVIDTGKWLPGRKVLLNPRWIESIDWARSKVNVQLARETIKNAPGYENPAAITREYEERLFGYYGKPGYWVEAQGVLRRGKS